MNLTRKELQLLALFFIINFVTAIFVELNDDEAYYWVYAQSLDWGYYDHPPMVALFIKAGYFLFESEIGIRLLTLFSSVGFTLLLLKCLPKEYRDYWYVFIIMVFATPGLQIYSFITTPDVPLLLFSILFIYLFKQSHEKLLYRALLLGFIGALTFYSKYHGAIFVIFLVLANFKQLGHWFWYVTGIFTLLFVLPHLYWQWENDWPSVRYHLVERNKIKFRLEYPISFIVNQFVYFNPFFLFLAIKWLVSKKVRLYHNNFERTLAIITGLFWLFFGFRIFKGHVEPQWTLLGVPCFLILFYRYVMEQPKAISKVLRYAYITIGILGVARILLMFDILPIKTQFHGGYLAVKEYKALADGKPVVFLNSYQAPSKYYYVTGDKAYVHNGTTYRQNQYDLDDQWQCDLYGKEFIFFNNVYGRDTVLPKSEKKTKYHIDTYTFKNIELKNLEKVSGKSYKAVLSNDCSIDYSFKWGTDDIFLFMFYDGIKWSEYELDIENPPVRLEAGQSIPLRFTIPFEGDLPVGIPRKICYKYQYFIPYTLADLPKD